MASMGKFQGEKSLLTRKETKAWENIIYTDGGVSVMVWGFFAASGSGHRRLAVID